MVVKIYQTTAPSGTSQSRNAAARRCPRTEIHRSTWVTALALEDTMATTTYEKPITALLVIDPYNDFISEGGKVWDRIRGVAEANGCVAHMLQVLNAARSAGLRVFYVMHRRYRPGDYETWSYIAPIQKAAWKSRSFEYGTWGGEIRAGFEPKPGEIVTLEHWCSSGFANTDLDLQLKKHGIHKLIVIGLIAHTCVEATVRFAAELGYEVTVVRDATADYSEQAMHAALDVNIPNYASAVVTAEEIVGLIFSVQSSGNGETQEPNRAR
jgi:ureidoacrylate peracid hydrolase